jgi:hypothetical protein
MDRPRPAICSGPVPVATVAAAVPPMAMSFPIQRPVIASQILRR